MHILYPFHIINSALSVPCCGDVLGHISFSGTLFGTLVSRHFLGCFFGTLVSRHFLRHSFGMFFWDTFLPVSRCENVLCHVPFTQSQRVVHVVAVFATHLTISEWNIMNLVHWTIFGLISLGLQWTKKNGHLAIKTVVAVEEGGRAAPRRSCWTRTESQLSASWTWLLWGRMLILGRGCQRLQGGHSSWLFPPKNYLSKVSAWMDGWMDRRVWAVCLPTRSPAWCFYFPRPLN